MSILSTLWPEITPQKDNTDLLIENQCLVMKFYGIGKRELDELDIPEFLIMRDYAFKSLTEEQKMMSKLKQGAKIGHR